MVYEVLLHKGEDFGYWVECPSLPGCISQGKTRREALENIKESIELYLEVENKEELPEVDSVYVRKVV